MKIENMKSSRGNKVPNQVVITDNKWDNNVAWHVETFQSYNSVIATKETNGLAGTKVTLDSHYWDYSVTTVKYRNQFLGETKKETEAKIKSGEYKLSNLN